MNTQNKGKPRAPFRNLNYRYKLLIAMLSVAVVPILAVSVLMYQTSVKFVAQNLEQSRRAQMVRAVQELEDKIQIYEHMTDYLVSNREVQRVLQIDPDEVYELYQGYTETVDPLLEMNMYYHHDISRMTFYLKEADLEHGTTVEPLSVLEQENWYQDFFAEGECREVWIISKDDRAVYYVRPIAMYTQMRAVLVIVFDYDGFLSPLTALAQESERLSLRSFQGELLYAVPAEPTGTEQDPTGADQEAIGKKKGGIVLAETMEEQGWELQCLFTARLNFGEYTSTLWVILIAFLDCVIYIILVSWITTKTLTNRITGLTETVSRIGENGTDRSLEDIGNLQQYDGPMDEIGILTVNVQQMVDRLKELRMEVYHEKIAHRELEMKALQAQINPHFLYNSLSIINWMALDAGADDVSDVTLKLAEFYRTTLNRGSTLITVDGEIRNIRSYLCIQLIMHDHEFDVTWDLNETVNTWTMPKLVLQPLVENALEHGLDLKTEGEKQLYLKIGREKDDLVLIVRDNGVGMPQEKADALIYYDSKGYGVKNVKERIRLLYGENHQFRITSEEGKGTEVYIRFPGAQENAGRQPDSEAAES